MVNMSLQGNQISMNVKTRRRQVNLSGTVNGDTMSGTTEKGAAWTATRSTALRRSGAFYT